MPVSREREQKTVSVEREAGNGGLRGELSALGPELTARSLLPGPFVFRMKKNRFEPVGP
jgi:hypothetical protein